MAVRLVPSSFRCDCMAEVHFFERTVGEMIADSRKRRSPVAIWDNEKISHAVEFHRGKAVAVICPKLGRCEITGWDYDA